MEDDIVAGEQIYYAHTLNPKLKKLHIVPLSDAHYGNPLFSKHHFLKTLKFIADTPYVYTILNGDLCESSLRTSRGEIYKQVGTPQDQRDWMIDRLYPIRKKILGMTMGNHELRVWNEVGIDICHDIAKALGVPYRQEGILLKISFGSGNERHDDKPYTYFGYATHGYGGARTAAAKAVKVERVSNWIHADFYIMSHDHVVNIAPTIYLMPDHRAYPQKDKDGNETGFQVGRVQALRKMLVKSNAFLKWGSYAEAGGFPPVDLEIPIIKLSGEGKKRVRVEV